MKLHRGCANAFIKFGPILPWILVAFMEYEQSLSWNEIFKGSISLMSSKEGLYPFPPEGDHLQPWNATQTLFNCETQHYSILGGHPPWTWMRMERVEPLVIIAWRSLNGYKIKLCQYIGHLPLKVLCLYLSPFPLGNGTFHYFPLLLGWLPSSH